MKREIKIESIPELEHWKDFLTWMFQITDIVRMGAFPPAGTLANDIAKMVPTRLRGEVRMWFNALDEVAKLWLTTTWRNFATGMLTFLGEPWQAERTIELNQIRYRQKGHDSESPMEYFVRKLYLIRLVYAPQTEALAIQHLTSGMPLEWSHWISADVLPDVTTLLTYAF